MSRPAPPESRRTGVLLLGLFAIPFLSVSSAVLVADVASTTDPRAAAVGVPAVLGGVLMGVLGFRLARVVHCGAAVVWRGLRPALDRRIAFVSTAVRLCSPEAFLAPAVVFVPASIGRRGPPLSLR